MKKNCVSEPPNDCEMTAALRKLQIFLSMYTSKGEKLIGESSMFDSTKTDYPLLHSNIGTSTSLQIHTINDGYSTVLYLQSTKGYYSSYLKNEHKSCTIKIHDYSIQTFGSDVRIRGSVVPHVTNVPLDDFINMPDDTMFQYCTMYKDFEILHNMFQYALNYDIFLDLPFDCITEYGDILENECKRHGWI